ncbi:MAG: sulfotransferase [Candidatus Thiodiazotropha sp. (ex Dulcina madagascariensis)]|nr:sulfotransferase [Candidatus Thiodiazotropha sp. (ex Dulcina madagascariensis)]
MKLIYIAGDNRSGSTMLDMMLAGHSEITSIGEAHQLRAYATKDIRYYQQTVGDRAHEMICFCGMPLESCQFWQGVQEKLGCSLETLDLKPFFLRTDLKCRPIKLIQKKILWTIFHLYPSLYSMPAIHRALGGDRIGVESRRLYEAVAKVSGKTYVLDSSKSLHRMHSIANQMIQDIKVILLCRDYKGNVYSKVKRGVPLLKAALQWKWTVQQMEKYSQKLPKDNVLRVKYEDICVHTESEMQRILEFLKLSFEESVLKRNIDELHHLGGSPSKYNGLDKRIMIDNTYESYLTDAQRFWLYRVVREEARIWGYAS